MKNEKYKLYTDVKQSRELAGILSHKDNFLLGIKIKGK